MERADCGKLALAVLASLLTAGCFTRTIPDAGAVDADVVDAPSQDAGAPSQDGDVDSGAHDSGPVPCEPGSSERVSCGMCGTRERVCTDEHVWEEGPCTGEQGQCLPGEELATPCGRCGTDRVVCTDACVWSSLAGCTDEGECSPGTTRTIADGCAEGELREVACDTSCHESAPGPCSADTCAVPGAVEVVPCGACGRRTRTCSDERVWEYGECTNEGECLPGATRTSPCGRCGRQLETCDATCRFGPPGLCTDEGACTPGSRIESAAGCPSGQLRLLQCDDACAYTIEVSACTAQVGHEDTLALCSDGLDNDSDPYIDCEDRNCCAVRTDCEPSSYCGSRCTSPGTTETLACGTCGTQTRTCTGSSTWSYGPCTDQGECYPGTMLSVPCGRCGIERFTCDATCQLLSEGVCEGEGPCSPGMHTVTASGCPPGQTRELACDDGCGYTIEVRPCRPPGTTFRVVAANLSSGTNQSYDPGEGLRILQGLRPDIVLIQEFNVGDGSSAALRAFVDTACGTECRWTIDDPPGRGIPNGIISRFPILASGSWDDTTISDREYHWARIDVPGARDLWAVSVHLKAGEAYPYRRSQEAAEIASYVTAHVPSNAFLVVGGDFNTFSNDPEEEPALAVFETFLVMTPYPHDGTGNIGTNAGRLVFGARSRPYDRVLANPLLDAYRAPVAFGANRFPDGLVFDSRVYTPLSDVDPVLYEDSGALGMQHMAVVRDFTLPD